MLTSLALIFLVGLTLGWLSGKLHLPELVGMMITGMMLGPYASDLLDSSILNISAELRQMALVIILLRAGLTLDLKDLRQAGRPAVLLCFLPACFEILGVILLAPVFFKELSFWDAAVMGAVIAAVSPAVIVPRMIRLMEDGYGCAGRVPQMLLAGASVDDVFVIVLFTAFTTLSAGNSFSASALLTIPVSIFTGLLIGVLLGLGLTGLFRGFHMRDSVKIVILLSCSFLVLQLEKSLAGILPVSGLLAVMGTGLCLRGRYPQLTQRLSQKCSKLWVAAEVLLFVLVGATVDLRYAVLSGAAALAVVLGALVLRMLGVLCCLVGTPLTPKERLFCMLAYIPKATVQAAIGGIPLTMGLGCGHQVLTVSVLSILVTAPLGAAAIDRFYPTLLKKEQ